MLTLKLITEETDRVIRGLEKKHFTGAKEAIDQVLAVDKKRREAQQELDKSLNEQKQLSGQIGRLMKEGKKDEAEQVKAQVAALTPSLMALCSARLPPQSARLFLNRCFGVLTRWASMTSGNQPQAPTS